MSAIVWLKINLKNAKEEEEEEEEEKKVKVKKHGYVEISGGR